MASKTKLDDNMRQIIEETIELNISDNVLGDKVKKALISNLMKSYSEAAVKRRNSFSMRNAFKAGFMLAKKFGKYCQWHEQYWSKSDIAMQMRVVPAANDDAPVYKSRYASMLDD